MVVLDQYTHYSSYNMDSAQTIVFWGCDDLYFRTSVPTFRTNKRQIFLLSYASQRDVSLFLYFIPK